MLRNNLGLSALKRKVDENNQIKKKKNKVYDETKKKNRFLNVLHAKKFMYVLHSNEKINQMSTFFSGLVEFNRADNLY